MKVDSKSSDAKSPSALVSSRAKQKKQLAMVAILLLGLLIALFAAPKRDVQSTASDKPANANLVSLKLSAESTSATIKDKSLEQMVAIRELPKLTNDQIASIDLFQRALIESQPETVHRRPVAKRTLPHRVGAVYGAFNGTGQTALIDGHIVQSGEKLDSGMRVIAVSPEGVRVAP